MRKLLLSTLFVAALFSAKAQNLDDVQEKMSKGKWDEAKEKIDKILADSKNQGKANPWYYKGKVYAELARMDTSGTYKQDLSKEAFEAFKKYQQLEPKNTLMLLDQNVGLFQLYDMHYNRGIKNYNKKDYTGAFNDFRAAIEVGAYTREKGFDYNGFKVPELDTTLVNLAATAAYMAKDEEQAIAYYEKLANARLKDKEFREVYGMLAEHYLKKNDPKADKYLQLGKELFPDENYWISLEFGDVASKEQEEIEKLRAQLEQASNKKDIEEKINKLEMSAKEKRAARYEEMIRKYPTNALLTLDYAIEMFNNTYSYEKKPADYTARQEKLRKALEQAIQVQPNSSLANYVMSQHIYNEVYDLEEQLRAVRGTTPADQAKKKDLTAKIDRKYEDLLEYSQKAYDLYSAEASLKAQDKANYRKVINQLIDYHQRKKQADKVTMYQNKLKSL